MGFSLYIHLPYCLRKCPYCDFNTYAVNTFPEQGYVAALASELDAASRDPLWAARPVDTVFFGGGTPSLFSAASLGGLLELINSRFGLGEGAEITMEANPGSLEGGGHDKLAGFRAAGINRLSLGAQSFNARHLETLGRLHSAEDTVAAIGAAREVGFERLSCDLIFAIPGQSSAEARDDLARLIDFAPEHISPYNLTYERGTPLTGLRKAGLIEAIDEESERVMYEQTIEALSCAGYDHYEISNFARPGQQARHNLTYWRWRDYLGVGAGAHGFARFADAAGTGPGLAMRYANLRLPQSYMSAKPGGWADTTETIDRESAIAEFLMLGLRLLEGIAEADFRETFACGFTEVLPELEGLVAHGLIAHSDGKICLTRQGLLLADSVISRLASDIG